MSTNRERFVTQHGALCDELKDITARKNADYTGAGTDDPFHNFKSVQELGICTTEQGFLTRMTDKMARIASLTKTGKQMVKDESVEDTLKDLANYSLLMICYLRSQRPAVTHEINSNGAVSGNGYWKVEPIIDPYTQSVPWATKIGG